MKKILLVCAGMCISLSGAFAQQQPQDWANFARYAEANKTEQPGRIVFLGNSITEGWAKQRPEFFNSNGYIGRGIGGQVSSQMLVRFRRDVLDLKPKAVVILAGTNDIAQNNGYISVENMFGNIVSMCELAKVHKVHVFLCSVVPTYEFPWRKELVNPAGDIVKLNSMLKAYAASSKLSYVDYHSALKDSKGGMPPQYAGDGVHPTPEGYAIMEQIVKKAIDDAGLKGSVKKHLRTGKANQVKHSKSVL